jgi:putative membrane protein
MDIVLLGAIFGSLGEAVLKILINAAALMIGAYLLKGVEIQDFVRALLIALVLSLLNATLGTVLHWITTPLRWLTLGLFAFVVNAALLLLTAHFMRGFNIRDFWSAFVLAIILSLSTTVMYKIFL